MTTFTYRNLPAFPLPEEMRACAAGAWEIHFCGEEPGVVLPWSGRSADALVDDDVAEAILVTGTDCVGLAVEVHVLLIADPDDARTLDIASCTVIA